MAQQYNDKKIQQYINNKKELSSIIIQLLRWLI